MRPPSSSRRSIVRCTRWRGTSPPSTSGCSFLRRNSAHELSGRIEIGRGRPRLAKGQGPSPTVNARLDDELADLLEQRADRDGFHKSEIVREALRAYLV